MASSYSVGPAAIKRLVGKSFELHSEVLQRPVRFRIESAAEGTPRGPKRGEEAYGMLVDCDHPTGLIPSFLKILKIDAPGRLERNQFLMRLGLAGEHWMFQGFPYGSLSMVQIGGVAVLGHVSRQVRGPSGDVAPSLKQLIETDWSFDLERRRRLAGQLCCTVHVLEGLELVHGDLSLGNVLVGWDWESGGGEVAVLCDYDGFYHPSQPLLPLEHQGKPVRRCGSPGFFYPELLEQIRKHAPDVAVRTDRMALGALVCQLMVWQSGTAEQLGRYELLDDSDIESRNLSRLPPSLWEAWPQGYDLLEEALKATSIESMPSPRRWLAELGGPPLLPPLLLIRNRGYTDWQQLVRMGSPTGTLGAIDPELQAVSFERLADGVRLTFGGPASGPLMVKQNALDFPKPVASNQVTLQIGGHVVSGPWGFECTADDSTN